jgi:peptidoglycan/LPS O-acetylase OafA/YrhL
MVSHYTNNVSFWFGIKPSNRVFFSGDLGVELFFALSGFLIGRILLDIADRDPSWRNLRVFLVRRWMRTLPLYWLWLIVIALAYPPAAHLGAYLLRFGTLTQNLDRPMTNDFWYAVSWSLTIEEWFYILFGVGVILATRLIRRPWAFWIPLLVLLTVPAALRLCVPGFADWSNGLNKVVPFRLDEIGYGVVAAWLYTRRSWIFRHPCLPLLAGLALVAAMWLGPVQSPLYQALRYNVTVVGCALCLPAAIRVRNLPPPLAAAARTLSRQSYALYLVHLTLLVDLAQGLWWRHRISAPAAVALAVVLPFVVAELASRWIEQPIMRRRPRQWFEPARQTQHLTWNPQKEPAAVAKG